jgi:hypothetical protein
MRQRGAIVLLGPEHAPGGQLEQALTAEPAPQAESLLAEAQWALWPSQDPDTKRAVLLAAIALEVKTPEVLRAMASDDSEKLLKASVNFQLNAVAKAVGGQALKDHGHLNRRVKKLFDLRNDVAHRGRTPDYEDANVAVAAATQVFSWLDGRTA